MFAGLRSLFVKPPPKELSIPPDIQMNPDEKKFVDVEIAKLLHNGSIREIDAPPVDGWFSPIFVIPKSGEINQYRLILNMKKINKLIQYKHLN